MVLPKTSDKDVYDAHYIKWSNINRTNYAYQPEAAFVLFMHRNRGLFSSSCQWSSGDRWPLTVCQTYPSVNMHGALIQTSAIWVFHHHRHTCNYSFCRSDIKYSPIEGDPHPLQCFFCTVSSSFKAVKLVRFYLKYFREMWRHPHRKGNAAFLHCRYEKLCNLIKNLQM